MKTYIETYSNQRAGRSSLCDSDTWNNTPCYRNGVLLRADKRFLVYFIDLLFIYIVHHCVGIVVKMNEMRPKRKYATEISDICNVATPDDMSS